MKGLKNIIRFACLAVAAVSFFVMVWGFLLHTTVYGFTAIWIFGLSFFLGVFLSIPDDEHEGIIDYGRNLG